MSYRFSDKDFHTIGEILGVQGTNDSNTAVWKMINPESRQAQIISIHNSVTYPNGEVGSAIIVQTKHGYFELHQCTGYITFEPDEVIFITEHNQFVSGMVLGKHCTCSMFSPIQKSALSANFTELDPALIMSAMQLSLAEQLLEQ